MVLTKERAELLANFLTKDPEQAKVLLELSPEEAIEKINAAGYDFTIDEVVEFGSEVREASSNISEEQLNESMLEEVTGGALVAASVAFSVAFAVGQIIGKNAPW